jgi:1-deoxy-D-xylulose-5-phosphate synthase
VCLQNLPVVFAVDRAGCVGADGFTHHGMYDIPLLKPLAGMRIKAPTCAEELKEALDSALASPGPVAIRYPRGVAPGRNEMQSAADGRESPAVRLLAVGDQVRKARRVAELLAADGIAAETVPVVDVKPVAVAPSAGILTVSLENGAVCGGFGESAGADMKFGWPDAAVCHGTVEELEKDHGFDAESVALSIRRRLGDKVRETGRNNG